MKKITPIILSGGSGTRLWPLSRALNPKQFLNIFTDKSLFEETISRTKDDQDFFAPTIICNEEHRFTVALKLEENNIKNSSIILEPCARNTAPAIAVAAFDVLQKNGDRNDAMLVMPCDHIIKNVAKFKEIVKDSLKIIDDFFITFGIAAKSAHTGYGYIKIQEKIANSNSYFVEKFVEKPNKEKAQEFLQSQKYLWNSGIFMFKASKYLSELKKAKPEIYENVKNSYEKAQQDFDFTRVNKEFFEKCENISIDYAIMENLSQDKKIAVSKLDLEWDDVGNFDAISQNLAKDENQNNIIGDIIAYETRNCYINSQNKLTATINVQDLIIVSLKDVVLVANKENAQDVKKIYEELEKQNRQEIHSHPKVLRPWGSFEVLEEGKNFKVKKIIVKPKSSLSLQMHNFRSEHWIVVKGVAEVVCGEEKFKLDQNHSTFIPIKTKHRLENQGSEDLEIIEVQTGNYLGEDDIIRFEDFYGRKN